MTIDRSRLDRRIDIAAAVILSITTILTAWTAFQSSKWSGVQMIALSEAGAARTESVRFSTLAGQQTAIDVALFTQWAEAVATDDGELRDFIRERFRPEFVPAFEAWVASGPLEDPDAPSSPFVVDDYRLEASAESDRFAELAEQQAQTGREANETSDNYVLMTVLFAVVLFFVGVGTRLEAVQARVGLLALAALGLGAGIVILTMFPLRL